MYNVRVEVDGTSVKVWRRPAAGGAEELVASATTSVTGAESVRFTGLNGGSYAVDDVRILASGLERETVFAYRDNNEIESATDYNGAASYTFDAWGRTNTESKNGVTRTYSWTSANLLKGIDSSDTNETDVGYVYTGDLKRVWRSENGSLANVYQWDAGFNVISEATVGNPLKTFVPGLAEVIGNDLDTSADYRFLTTDHLGSTRGMFDGSKTALGSWEFTPYGSPFQFAGPADVTQLFTGHDLDRATGQYYAPFRYLNAGLGRWASSDPLGMVDGANMYSYAMSNPISLIDILGLNCGSPSVPFSEWLVPEEPQSGCSFGMACYWHDECYKGQNTGVGYVASRKACDRQFLDNMLAACTNAERGGQLRDTVNQSGLPVKGSGIRGCNSWARTYYRAVRLFGWMPFNNARGLWESDKPRSVYSTPLWVP